MDKHLFSQAICVGSRITLISSWAGFVVGIFAFSIPQTLHSSCSRLLLPCAWSGRLGCCRVFSVFSLGLVVSAHLATDRGLCPCSCPSSLWRLSLLVIHCWACGRGWFFFWRGGWGRCLDPALVLFRPLDLGVGLFQCFFFPSARLVILAYAVTFAWEFPVPFPATVTLHLSMVYWCRILAPG